MLNPTLPGWFGERMPKGHLFNTDLARDDFPGSEQVEELWRWIEDLPANRDHAVTAVTLRDRAKRLETLDRQRDPNSWASPAVEGETIFEFERSPGQTYRLGNGEYQFVLYVSGCGEDSVYVLKDSIHAVGINRVRATHVDHLAAQLTSGRSVVAQVGDQAILQNEVGALCLVDILDVQREVTAPAFMPASLRFRYRIHTKHVRQGRLDWPMRAVQSGAVVWEAGLIPLWSRRQNSPAHGCAGWLFQGTTNLIEFIARGDETMVLGPPYLPRWIDLGSTQWLSAPPPTPRSVCLDEQA